jgi:hypothetical protein
MNKKGQAEIIFAIAIFSLIVIVAALVIGLSTGILTFFTSTVNDATSGLGVISNTNMTQVQELTIGTVDTIAQSFKFLSAALIVFGLLGILIFSWVVRINLSNIWIGIWLFFVFILIIVSIFVSNMYEEFINGADEVADELKSMVITSFLILHMPVIITIISFIGGVIIFSGIGGEFT